MSSLTDFKCSAHALKMIKRERERERKKKTKQTKQENLFHQVAQLAAGLRPLSFPQSVRCDLLSLVQNTVVNSVETCGMEGLTLADKCTVAYFSVWEIN